MSKRPLCLAYLLLMLGIWLMDLWGVSFWHSSQNPQVEDFLRENKSVQVIGEVYQQERKKDSSYIYLKEANLALPSNHYPIKQVKVIWKTQEEQRFPIGSTLAIKGELLPMERARNPGQFDAASYYGARKIGYTLFADEVKLQGDSFQRYGELLDTIRCTLKNSLEHITSEKWASLLTAMVLGDKTGMEEEVKIRFQMSGIAHVLAISGLHISLLGMGFYRLLRRMGIPVLGGVLLSSITLISYGILTGGSVSTARAVIMFLTAMGAKAAGRTYDLLSALSLAGILILMDSPNYLYDGSFLLSFGAIAGIAVILPAMSQEQEKKEREVSFLFRMLNSCGQGLKAGIAIWLSTLPVILYFFYEVSLYGFLANLLVLPSVAIVLVCAIGGALAGVFLPLLGKIVVFPAVGLLWIYDSMGSVIQHLPFSTVILGRPSVVGILLYGLCVVGWILLKKYSMRARYILLVIGLFCLTFHSRGNLRITFLDVGQGDSAVVESATNQTYLIDGGSSSESKVGTYRILPFLKCRGIRTLDYILISHTDADHMNGITELLQAVANRQTSLRIGCILLPWWGEEGGQMKQMREIEELAKIAGCRVSYIKKGDRITDGELSLTCLHPGSISSVQLDYTEEPNAGSQVWRLRYKNFSALFTGDVEGEGERLMQEECKSEKDRECTLLKVAHHGSKNSTGDELLELLKPRASIISCGEDNSYGHPHQELLQRLKDANTEVYQTPDTGAITVKSDGQKTFFSFYLR